MEGILSNYHSLLRALICWWPFIKKIQVNKKTNKKNSNILTVSTKLDSKSNSLRAIDLCPVYPVVSYLTGKISSEWIQYHCQ